MGPSKLRAEWLIAWAAAVAGAVGIACALAPESSSRVAVVRSTLSTGFPDAARIGALTFGCALVLLSRSLLRRRRRAWQVAVAAVVALAAAHLAKDFNVVGAAICLCLLAALVGYRRRFDVPGDPATLRPVLALCVLLASAGAVAASEELRGAQLPDRASDTLTAVGLLLGFAALYLWLRPLSQAVAQTVAERRAARRLVETYGSDSLSFFALRRDKNYLFSPSRRSFLAYRVLAGTLLISGDPVGPDAEVDGLLAEARRLARANGWRVAVLSASARHLDRYRRFGLRPIRIGDEAVLRPEGFSLEGRPIRKVRQSVTRLVRAGYRLEVMPADEARPELRAELDAVSDEWRGNRPERGFTMASDDLYLAGTIVAAAVDARGRVGGFLHLAPTVEGGWSLSTMRRRPSAPNGLMEFLIVETVAWARARGCSELSLNFCALTDLVCRERAATHPRRLARRVLLAADRVFQLERLYVFNKKFFPEWRPRYLCVERLSDLPAVGLAYLRVEQLLVPPRPWARRGSGRIAA